MSSDEARDLQPLRRRRQQCVQMRVRFEQGLEQVLEQVLEQGHLGQQDARHRMRPNLLEGSVNKAALVHLRFFMRFESSEPRNAHFA